MIRPFPNEPAWLPNLVGFRFEALLKTYEVKVGEVIKKPDGMHTTQGVAYRDILRWRSVQ